RSRRTRRSSAPSERSAPLSLPPVDHERDGDTGDRDPPEGIDVLLQPALHGLAAPDQEPGDEEEPPAAADERRDDEHGQREVQRARGDRENLVRDRREAG